MKGQDLVGKAKQIYQTNLLLQSDETVLIITDTTRTDIAQIFFEAGLSFGNDTQMMVMKPRGKSGEEPPKSVAEAMKWADIVLCITEHSLTHTKARKAASKEGARVATMPGVTMDMLTEGALTADYDKVKKLCHAVSERLNRGKTVTIFTGKDRRHQLTMNINGRRSVDSTGVFPSKGDSGNLPSGESFLAPVEGSANGQILIDASISGIGKLVESVLLTIKEGRLIEASSDQGARLLDMLGNGAGREVGELGIGANHNARVTGNILEDEKIYGTIHIAFGTNITFGGTVDAGVHIDCVTLRPELRIDDQVVVKEGDVLV
ncbi:leucyl aminopeptidase (aminopeptidase T) [Scopulibacillus darangshiensis]|uniref:Leucyl aminopeptidase (Aminopeptidase T) n=1 Tax=Scopulibacillus darangshiensis TaxID=442528 RepID=A0A4V2SN41_9BACL|nr:aminopeptidase [Scopulibacillus darangshiensis]TCP29596.1 leucyl aminopeptidase (aminopeptidase T) [Scopulibacillus darangshiensis]